MPTVIREFARASAGEVGGIAAGVFSSGELVTAVRNGSDKAVRRPSAGLLALPFFPAFFYRHLARRVANLNGVSPFSLASFAHTSINVAIDGQRGWREDNR
jgi:hypothetical protein